MAETLTFKTTSNDGSSQGDCCVSLTSRIASKTFDAIHRSHVFTAKWNGQDVFLKAWELSDSESGKEMEGMCVVLPVPIPITLWNRKSVANGCIVQSSIHTLTGNTHVLRRYQNEKTAFGVMASSGFVPRVLADGYLPRQHELALETRILITENRSGEWLRTCWKSLGADEQGEVRGELRRFFQEALGRGIYHDDLRHLRNCLWDREKHALTVLDFELVGVKWKGPFTAEEIERVTDAEIGAILSAAENME